MRIGSLHLAIPGLLRAAARAAVDLLYPPACLACRASTACGDSLCPTCWRAMRFIERPFCDRTGTPFALDLGLEGLISPAAMADPPAFGRARAVAQFDDGPARRLIHRLKYGDRLELSRAMGRWMARAGDELLGDADVIVPVPLHRGRLMTRRFNQSALLARSIGVETGLPVELLALTRVKPTRSQVSLTRTQRAANVQGAFTVPDEVRHTITQKRVVLVDDVLTSGATLNAATRALLRGGAASVDALVFARVASVIA